MMVIKPRLLAIAFAITLGAAAGGGIVRVPPGIFRSGTICLRSGITLQLDKGATVLGSTNAADYPLTTIRWAGLMQAGHSSLIHAANAARIAIVGEGTIRGGDPTTSRNPRGPELVEFRDCRDIRVEGVKLKNHGIWTLHPPFCTNVVVRGVTFATTGHNPDGLDPDSCRDVLIMDRTFSTQDDCIAIKSGKGEEGRRLAVPSENIVISNCVFHSGHSVALGSTQRRRSSSRLWRCPTSRNRRRGAGPWKSRGSGTYGLKTTC